MNTRKILPRLLLLIILPFVVMLAMLSDILGITIAEE